MRGEQGGQPAGADEKAVDGAAEGAGVDSAARHAAAAPDGAEQHPDAPARSPEEIPPWDDLPESVRTALLAAAARALGALPPDGVPHALIQVARFVPAKRAKSGAVPLARALESDAGFRAVVAQTLPPGFGERPDDPVAAAARAYLLRVPSGAGLFDEAARVEEVAALRAQVATLTATVHQLTEQLARDAVRPQPGRTGHTPQVAQQPGPEARAEIAKLRGRLREQGTRVKQAEDAAAEAILKANAERDEAMAQLARESDAAQMWRQRSEQETRRAEAARQALERARDESSRDRADGDRRIALLLDTVVDAAVGLRREWRLATEGADPADVVARGLPAAGPTPQRRVDRSLLLQWIKLPGAHLIVDGYNVTKTGYPELTLADQRDRLIRALGALSARTGAEITVVFDGAAVVAAPASTRDVRVVFSPEGVIADDVIRRMAAAEPAGRVVVVVSSDREVADGVRRSGARTSPSSVLLELLV